MYKLRWKDPAFQEETEKVGVGDCALCSAAAPVQRENAAAPAAYIPIHDANQLEVSHLPSAHHDVGQQPGDHELEASGLCRTVSSGQTETSRSDWAA
jgi:hypothetical protein